MHKVSLYDYKDDKYYLKIVRAVEILFETENSFSPIEIFIQLGILSSTDVEKWEKGQIPYLERVINCNLNKAGRILQILRFHTHDLNLKPVLNVYNGRKGKLRFSKSGVKKIEEMYSRHFEIIGKKKVR